jgi:hypothetical protein
MDFTEIYSRSSEHIIYIKVGGSYQLTNLYGLQTVLRPENDIVTERLHLLTNGMLYIFPGYCWDGTSGPVIDRKTNMRAGCGHDGLYQLSRMRKVPFEWWPRLDLEFAKVLEEDGAWPITVWADLKGLSLAKGKAAHPDSRKQRHVAP